MNRKWRVLVTGCGGDIGQSIGKILKSKPDLFSLVIGADIHNDHASKFIYEKCYIISRCSEERYREDVYNIVNQNNIDVVIPISEPELRLFGLNNYGDSYLNVPTVLVNQLALDVGFDKMATSKFLEKNELPYPKTYPISRYFEDNFPVLIKSRNGSGGKSIHVVSNQTELLSFQNIYPEYIVQEYLDDKDGEFTCGLFRSSSGEIRDIIFKRKLIGGFSGYGERVENEKVSSVLSKLAISLNLVGSINVQLRIVGETPVIFEINPRFSSTVLFRHLMGFEDLIWSIQDKFNLKINCCNLNLKMNKFYKGFSEYVE